MKVLIIGDKARYLKFLPSRGIPEFEPVFCKRDASQETLLKAGKDAEILFADAIAPVSGELIRQMPRLKLIHSEGVAYNAIDLAAARKQGVFVCNNKGCNAQAVAEVAILLMLELLRGGVSGHRQVRRGLQIQTKETAMVQGVTELSQCSVGFVGFGDIARETAKRLSAFGCRLYYYSPHPKDEETHRLYQVSYLPLDQLAQTCRIISLHAAVTEKSRGMIGKAFFSLMRRDAYLINTARGELVDQLALQEALVEGRIAGAGLDTLFPEPVTADNPLVDLPPSAEDKVVFTPHIGGITTASFQRAHRHMWENAFRILQGKRPYDIVNGL